MSEFSNAPLQGSSSSNQRSWTPTEVAQYLSEHQLLQRINLGISDAVHAKAANPLLNWQQVEAGAHRSEAEE